MRVLLVSAVLLLPQPTPAADWVSTVRGLSARVPRVEVMVGVESGVCSGVFVNAAAGYVLAPAHAVTSAGSERIDVTVGGREAAIVRANRILDLAVLRVTPKASDVSMPLALVTPPAGSPIAVIGYGFGSRPIIMQFGHMALPLDEDSGRMRMNIDVLPGDSGGAIIDELGRLIGMQSAVLAVGPMHLGVAVPIEAIREYVAPYLPSPVAALTVSLP